MSSTSAVAPSRPRTIVRTVLLALAGVAGAIAIGWQSGVAPVIMVCGAIYLCAAATGRRWASWVAFAASFVVLTPGILLHAPWISFAALGVIQAALLVVGLVRGAWRTPVNRRQLFGAVAFSALALGASVGFSPWAGIVAIVALLAHGAWDLWHHRRDIVVSRSYAAFCAALDVALAIVVAIPLVTGS